MLRSSCFIWAGIYAFWNITPVTPTAKNFIFLGVGFIMDGAIILWNMINWYAILNV